MRKNAQMVSVYAAVHFLVDFACAFLMFRAVSGAPYWFVYVLAYNFCAFAVQMPLGVVADKVNRNFIFAVAGCALVGLSYIFWDIPAAAAVAAGLGNAAFHVGGGLDVLNVSEKPAPLGLFVAPGALGVYFGTVTGNGTWMRPAPIIFSLLIAVILILTMKASYGDKYPTNAYFTPKGDITAAACVFTVVVLRSYVGLSLLFPWKTGIWAVILVCAVALGKVGGGFAAGKFGLPKVSAVSLGVAAALFMFPLIPAFGVISTLAFNMTMPVTLWVAARIFPGAKGFSFGLLSFGLFMGYLPTQLGAAVFPVWAFAVLSAASLALLLAGVKRAKQWN